MTEAFLKLLGSALSIWDSKEKTKYQDKYQKLMKDWYEENNKPDWERSNAVLDNIEFELRVLGNSFSAQIGSQGPGIKS